MASGQNTAGRTVTRSQFFAQIGLRDDNQDHQRLFGLMQNEAAAGSRRLLAQRGNANAQIDEESFRREVLAIYASASSETRGLYDFGIAYGTDGSMIDNWVIRWMLWQAIHQPNGH
ncbi:hypothetical protein M409DRAFT_53193 [Zasmidium cellare ATCC 36951]|uniref:Uncharacterized protein n=1 Tax=Zasmidium cellare ATCC 36951 TaxID=1080233 RepID=A0A6A6CQW7_ZASCE|nr:uncharacterized protein M409DRAFT_53193 [Zasmidium cellare ATCC 36951]KAF2168530.1 hypothetical protein M409DRAFT_53193 [Zasmidium cellare ATCC 36951]